MDILKLDNLYDSFREYQTRMIEQFNIMSKEFNFHVINANLSIKSTNGEIMTHLKTRSYEYDK